MYDSKTFQCNLESLKPTYFIKFSYSKGLSLNNKILDDLRGDTMVTPAKKLEDLIRLAELCVDLLQQNEEHYAEV